MGSLVWEELWKKLQLRYCRDTLTLENKLASVSKVWETDGQLFNKR